MRIQHNILSMNAYRNYTNNTSALGKNLEKLSSGYKINRAGDAAAGLAISEKMRAQIQGLNAAQKNVKDAISFVKTAEGAMQEIQDMLSRMKYLATQSANGPYNDAVDREALQDEVNSLLTEIDRIADSANFNDIYMLNGTGKADAGNPQAGDGTQKTNDGIMLTANPGISMAALKPSTGTGATATASVTVTSAPADALGTNSNKTGASVAGQEITVSFTGSKTTGSVKIAFGTATKAASNSTADIYVQIATTDTASAVFGKLDTAVQAYGNGLAAQNTAKGTAGFYMSGISVERATGGLKFDATFTQYEVDNTQSTGSGSTAKVATGQTVGIDFSKVTKNFATGDSITIGGIAYTFASGTGIAAAPAAGNTVTVQLGSTVDKTLANLAAAIDQQKATTNVGATYDATNHKLTLKTTQEMTVDQFKAAVDIDTTGLVSDPAIKTAVENAWDEAVNAAIDEINKGNGGTKYSITMQIGDTAVSYNQMELKILSMKTESLGIDGLRDVGIASIGAAAKAIDTIKEAINTVSKTRGELGAYQNRLEHTANNLSVMTENITDAESTIRDTDVADEVMAYTKNNILIQSAQAMLAQANAVPQGVLQLLQ